MTDVMFPGDLTYSVSIYLNYKVMSRCIFRDRTTSRQPDDVTMSHAVIKSKNHPHTMG